MVKEYPASLAFGHSDNTLATMIMALAMQDKKEHGDSKDSKGWWIIVLIVFFIALIFLALMMRERRHDGNGNGIGEILAATIAAKGMNEGNGYHAAFERKEIMDKLEHGEDRAETRRTQNEIGQLGTVFAQMGFGLSGQIHEAEKQNQRQFATLENQIGQLMQGQAILLQEKNNDQIISGVANHLRLWGMPACGALR